MVVYRDLDPRYFIVDSGSGGGKGKRVLEEIKDICWQNNVKCVIYETNGPGSATEIVRSLKQQNRIAKIYSVGGDDLLNEIINGIDFDSSVLGIIPVGSNNNFFKSLKNTDIMIDLGVVNKRYFINMVSFGLTADILKLTDDIKGKYSFLSNKISYLGGMLKADVVSPLNIEYNSKLMDITLMTICNGREYGIFKMAPYASISDGKLDICYMDYIDKKRDLLPKIFNIVKGSHANDDGIHILQVDKLTIKSDKSITCNIDGIIVNGTSFEFGIVPNRLELIPIDDPFLKDINMSVSRIK